MTFLRIFLLLAAAIGLNANLFAATGLPPPPPGDRNININQQDTSRFEEELNERDFAALKEFLNYRRREAVDKKDKSNLSISGDVRFEYRHLNETEDGHVIRGSGKHAFDRFSGNPYSRNDFDVEFDLRFDYILDRTWAVVHLQYDNSAGVDSEELDCDDDNEGWFGSGRCDDICLRKAFMGYNLWNDPCTRLDIELGRRGNLYHVFDSKLQFLSRLDGIILKYESNWECVANWYARVAGFVVDERVNHFGLCTEVGFLNILDTGFDVKYSFIDWNKHGRSRCPGDFDERQCCRPDYIRNPQAYRFYVSQWTLYYHLDPELLGRPAQFYAAILMNHGSKYIHDKIPVFCNGLPEEIFVKDPESGEEIPTGEIVVLPRKHKIRANLGWYVGFLVGAVKREGDWALEIQYQVCDALAVPNEDMSGIGRGNVRDDTITFNQRGNTNFQGWRVEGLYALTDNITIDSIVEHSRQLRKRIGGRHTYSKMEIEAIYAF